MSELVLIAALDCRGAIGKDGKLPWRLKADMEHFKNTTSNQVVIMGRRTFESLPPRFRPLPRRENWILSRDPAYKPAGCSVMKNEFEILTRSASGDIYVAGGAEIYHLFMPHATRLLLTHVKTEVNGADAFFPTIEPGWQQTPVFHQEVDENNQFAFEVVAYTKPPR